MDLKLPYGARPIVEARRAGQKPSDLVIVSLVGALPDEVNPVVQATANAYDWRFMRGLQACIFARPGQAITRLARAIGCHSPAWLAVWDVENGEGADAIVHLSFAAIDTAKTRFQETDFSVIFWPWLACENQQFRGEVTCG